ncbi:ribonuclease Z [Halobacillus sp. A5]|uniref:ribonuclease Z n=1 Tax=Halobacillus sp. A5 TaxID=2880263 RepID=UPI0020A65A14|nr:ribonuclease Z [Halobacillus sp. A5]MCP3025776.1 ribonuclease Z [Halobacillus sp. A5]
MELFFLGTGSGVPSKERNVSSLVLRLLEKSGRTWVFDCGEATQHQILSTSIRPRRIEKIFITHLHGDHIYGLPGLLSSRSFQGGETPVTLYGPTGIKDYVETSLKISGTRLKYQLYIEEIEEGFLFEDDAYHVEAIKLNHGLESFGYIIKEKDKLGELLPSRLSELGIEPGPVYQKIKDQEKTTLDNGQVILRKEVIGPPKKGKRVAILGDTRYMPGLKEKLANVDVLVHEATFASEEEEMAHDYFHSTVRQAAQLAKEANAKELVLTHISSRYQGESIKQLEREAAAIFKETTIAFDFYQHHIK